MNKFFTGVLCALALGGFAVSANAQTNTVAWGEPFTPSGEEIYAIQDYVGDIYVVTNSESDITYVESEWGNYSNSKYFMYWNDWGSGDYATSQGYNDDPDKEMYVNSDGYYVYGFTLKEYCTWPDTEKAKYGIKWPDGDVQFTVYQGKYDPNSGGAGEPEVINYITLNQKFEAGPDAPKWVFDNGSGDEIEDYYILSDSDQNLLSKISLDRYDEVNLPLTAVVGEDGNYVYVKNSNGFRIMDYTYYFTYSGDKPVNFTLVDEEYVKSKEFKLGDSITLTPTDNIWKCYGLDVDSDFYLETDSKTNYFSGSNSTAPFTMIVSSVGSNMFTKTAWTPVMNSETECYAYNGHLNVNDGVLIITYTSNTGSVTLKFAEGVYTEEGAAEYMDPAVQNTQTISVNDTSAGIELSWAGQEVTVVDASQTMAYWVNGEYQSSALEMRTYMQFLSDEDSDTDSGDPDDSTSEDDVFQVGQSGKILVFKFGAAVNNDPQLGEYVFNLPAGVVRNSSGEYNPQQQIKVTVISPTVGVVTPSGGESGPEFEEGEEIEFTITFDGTPQIVESDDAPVVITGITNADYEKRLDWAQDVVYVEGNTVLINLGTDMEPGAYYMNFLAGAVSVDGAENELIENFRFVVNAATDVDEPVEYLPILATVTPDPREDKVAPFETVTLTWTGYTLSLNEDCEESATFDGIEVEGTIEENALVFTVDALKDGSYSLVVPAQYVIGTDEEGNEYFNQSGNYVFVVDGSVGVKVIGSELNGNEAIFNLNGVRVNGNNLNKGIYIINGKKVVVK